MLTWIAAYSDKVFSQIISNDGFTERYVQVYQARLKSSYLYTTAFLSRYSISFDPANSGLFIWIDLSKWTSIISGWAVSADSPELALTKWLLTKGVYLEPGEVSRPHLHTAFILPLPGLSPSSPLAVDFEQMDSRTRSIKFN